MSLGKEETVLGCFVKRLSENVGRSASLVWAPGVPAQHLTMY